LTFRIIPGDGLTEADISLSATRLARMAAAVVKIFQLDPIVAQHQPDFPGPGLRAAQVGEKIPGARRGSLFFTHG
jgi:hypothetical protein